MSARMISSGRQSSRGRRPRMRARLAAAAAVVLLSVIAATSAGAATAVSSNWSGYAVTGTSFSSVTGSWTVTAADCASTSGTVSASAFWVGLGGNSDSESLEQVGTEANCSAAGAVGYSAWYELVPAASVKLPLAISVGDRITASVTVHGTKVTLVEKDLTTGKRAKRTRTMSSTDVSSAEWIAEAPSAVTRGGTEVLPLTNFGTIKFTNARATSKSGHTGSIADRAWTATRIALETTGGGAGGPGFQFASRTVAAEVVPTGLSAAGSAFSVTWSEETSSFPGNERSGPPSFGRLALRGVAAAG